MDRFVPYRAADRAIATALLLAPLSRSFCLAAAPCRDSPAAGLCSPLPSDRVGQPGPRFARVTLRRRDGYLASWQARR